jgi:hypothetical protein
MLRGFVGPHWKVDENLFTPENLAKRHPNETVRILRQNAETRGFF